MLAKALSLLDERSLMATFETYIREGKTARIVPEVRTGMEAVIEKYERMDYALSELVYACELSDIVLTRLEKQGVSVETTAGTIIIGTVEGDIRDFGKDIFGALLRCFGFNVVDLGVNVPIEKFVTAVRTHKPKYLGLSGILTTTFDCMHALIRELERQGLREDVTILVGGGVVDEDWVAKIGADHFCPTAAAGLAVIRGQ